VEEAFGFFPVGRPSHGWQDVEKLAARHKNVTRSVT
ncbi:uncharacterized protein METZ01_LOCUS288639, partial [marine metagenome]